MLVILQHQVLLLIAPNKQDFYVYSVIDILNRSHVHQCVIPVPTAYSMCVLML